MFFHLLPTCIFLFATPKLSLLVRTVSAAILSVPPFLL